MQSRTISMETGATAYRVNATICVSGQRIYSDSQCCTCSCSFVAGVGATLNGDSLFEYVT